MANRKNLVILTSLLVLAAFAMSACLKSYSTVVPDGTPTPIDENSLFVSPVATTDNAMDMVAEYATGSAIAGTSIALTQGTPLAEPVATETSVGGELTPGIPTVQPPAETVPPVSTPTTQPMPTTVTGRPGTYTLQRGEHPYCIARRFNVDPNELLVASGLSRSQAYSLVAGTVLNIPQSGKPFPDGRALNPHPATFVVGSTANAETVYAVACYYGDVDPSAIAQANGIPVSAPLTAGQQLAIP